MKPKVSTGYFTPQAGRSKKTTKPKHSESMEELPVIDDNAFQRIMKCPTKKKMILEFLAANKDAIEAYKQKEAQRCNSPIDKIKKNPKPFQYESPTALIRRRALQQMDSGDSASSSSGQSMISIDISSPVPFDKVLEGVVAYVEIKCKGIDRSEGAKAILKSLGAVVRDTFAKDVTHVIFKDGSFTTYQKAKLRKIHLVSILWVEFSRKASQKQPEKNYPAIRVGFNDNDTSVICSQMQKEYEDMIRDEYRKSIRNGTPLPSTKSLINRRRTMMSFSSTQETASSSISSQDFANREVASINQVKATCDEGLILNEVSNDEIEEENTSNETRQVFKPLENIQTSSAMDFTCEDFSNTTSTEDSSSTPVAKKSSGFKSILFDGRKTCGSIMTPERCSMSSIMTSDRSTNISDAEFAVPKRTVGKTGKASASLDDSNSFRILGRNTIGGMEKNDAQTSSKKSQNLSKNTSQMSSLHLSSEKENCSMPELRISSDNQSKVSTKTSFGSSENSCRLEDGALENVFRALVTPDHVDHVTVRKKSNTSSHANNSTLSTRDSEDSEIMTSVKKRKKPIQKDDNTKIRRKLWEDTTKAPTEISPKRTRRSIRISELTQSINKNKEDSEISGNEVVKKRASKRKSKLNPIESEAESPSKTRKETTPATDQSKTKKTQRRLYRPNECLVDLPVVDDEEERKERINARQLNGTVSKTPELVVALENVNNRGMDLNDKESSLEDDDLLDLLIRKSPKKKSRRKKEEVKQVVVNSSDDDQTDLLNEILNERKLKTQTPIRPVSASQTGEINPRLEENKISGTCRVRRSTLDFQTVSQTTLSRKPKMNKQKLPTIVCTKLHKGDVQVFSQIVKKLGKFAIEDEVSSRTTHVVAGEPKRTINMLRAVARGCWVLKFEWVLKSLESGKWLPEEDFEETNFAEIVQKSRLQRQAFGSSYSMDVFEDCPPIYVALSTNPRCSDLRELITLCKGTVVTIPRKAKIIVGECSRDDSPICVNETWVLDCITFNKKMPFKKKYLLGEKNARRSVAV